MPRTLSIQTAKFKFHQNQVGAASPNLMPGRVIHHAVL